MEITKAEMASAAAAATQSPAPEQLNGAEIMVRALQAEGVKYIWGYPGGAVLYIYDVPVFWLPFVFQDVRKGRRSGMLTPRFGFSWTIPATWEGETP